MRQFYTFISRKVTVNRLALVRLAALHIYFSSLVNAEKHTCTIKTSPNNRSKGLTRRLSSREQTWIHTEVSLFRVSRGILRPNLAEVSSKRKRNDGNVKRSATSCGRSFFTFPREILRHYHEQIWLSAELQPASASKPFRDWLCISRISRTHASRRIRRREKCAARHRAIARRRSFSFILARRWVLRIVFEGLLTARKDG